MNRRSFLSKILPAPMYLFGGLFAAKNLTAVALGCEAEEDSLKSFAFYQGLSPTETRSPSRRDGTFFDMPCILMADIAAGEEKEYLFWHGHGTAKHRFKITAEHFASLQNGIPVEIYTSVVDGHRHALRVDPNLICSGSVT